MDDCFGGSFLACAKVDGPDCLDDVLAQNRNNGLPYYPPEDFSNSDGSAVGLWWLLDRLIWVNVWGSWGTWNSGNWFWGVSPSFFFFKGRRRLARSAEVMVGSKKVVQSLLVTAAIESQRDTEAGPKEHS